jgi:hypothetical protein
MPSILEPQVIFEDVSKGVINSVKWNLAPSNSVDLCLNLVVDEVIGEAIVRKGSSIIGTQISGSNPVLGLFQFVSDLGTTKKLLSAVNGSIYHFTSGSWVLGKTGDNSSANVEFETFLDEVVRVNGVDAPLTSTDGITWASSSKWATGSMPTGKFVKVYKDQIIVAGVVNDPDTLYVSSVPDSSTNIVTWAVADGSRRITINPEDGQNIVGLGETNGTLIVLKDRAMYTWNNRSTQADTSINIGCTSQKSIVNCGTVLSFFNDKGFWLTDGGEPVKISRKIQKWIEGRTSTFAVPSYGNEDYLYASLGSCTIDGEAYTNIVVRYSMNTSEWVVYKYPFEVRAFTLYDDTTKKIVVGTSLSKVIQIESTANDDDGTDINFELRSHELAFGSRGVMKQITERAIGYCSNPQNILLQVKSDSGDWQRLGVVTTPVQNMAIEKAIEGHYFKFRAVGISNNRTHFMGVELPKITTLDY